MSSNRSITPEPVIFATTKRANATFFGSKAAIAASHTTFSNLPEDMQGQIFSFIRTVSAAKARRINKESAEAIVEMHEGYQYAARGDALMTAAIYDVEHDPRHNINRALPAWFSQIDCQALELIGKNLINLSKLTAETMENPCSFLGFVFEQTIVLALQRELISFDELIDLLCLKGNPEADNTVYALFKSQDNGQDIVSRLSCIFAAEKELMSCDIVVDKKFVADFLQKEIHGPQGYEMYLDDLIACEKSVSRPSIAGK
jgi:hypothetical protein